MWGVVKGGNNNGGSISLQQNIKVFIQATQPTATQVGDVWLNTIKTVNKVVLFNWEETYPSLANGVAVINLYSIKLREMFLKTFSVFSNKAEINIEYNTEKMINQLGTNDLKVFKNTLMEVYAKLGAVKLYTSPTTFEYVRGLYWNGTSWDDFSPSDIYLHVAVYESSTTYVKKLHPDGSTLWTNTLVSTWGVHSLCVDQLGYVYAGQSDGNLRKLHKDTGATMWTVKKQTVLIKSVVCDKDGTILVGRNEGHIEKYDTNGNCTWFVDLGSYNYRIVVDDVGNFYTIDERGRVQKFDSTGEEVWNIQPRGSSSGLVNSIGYCKGKVYATYGDDTYRALYIIDASTGAYTNVTTDRKPYALAVDKDGICYVGTYYGKIEKYVNGVMSWAKQFAGTTNAILDITIDKDGYITFTDSIDYVTKINKDGDVIWTVSPGKTLRSICATGAPYSSFPFLY